MRISDWSSDVCSSDLRHPAQPGRRGLKTGVMTKPIRIGQIVPSSNVTMETEIPALLRAREQVAPERFTFHSSRMRMKKVTAEELAAMDRDSDRCALELSDAAVDVLGYACLVAIMSMGEGYHRVSEARLHQRTVENGHSSEERRVGERCVRTC